MSVCYASSGARVTALDRANLDVRENELLAVVGESGCGKSTLALAIIGLLPSPPAQVLGGAILYKGTDLVSLGPARMKNYRGTQIAMIFQEPLSSLNPVYRVGNQIAEAITVHRRRKEGHISVETDLMQEAYKIKPPGASRVPRPRRKIGADLRNAIIDSMKLVRIPDPDQVIQRYPFELSGGMRQRIMIAMALSQEPALLIADEPTTALDVTTQAQVLKLMKDLMDKVKTSILLITHDLAVAFQVADRIAVMYAGDVVESSDAYDLFSNAMHPYTKALLACLPTGSKDESELKPIPGTVPDLRTRMTGCKFVTRCSCSKKICSEQKPHLIGVGPSHELACFLNGEQDGNYPTHS